MYKYLFASLLLIVSSSSAAAAEEHAAIRAELAKLFPDETVTSITKTPVTGVYEVMLGASLIYMSGDGKYVIRGDLYDLQGRENISDARRASAREAAFAELNSDDLIEFLPASGKAKKTLFVYTDIDCGYCRKLHLEVPELTAAGIAIKYLAFPRSGLDGESFKKAAAVWCSEDRGEALTAAKAGKQVSAPQCPNPVAEHFDLGRTMGVNGTPAVYSEDGRSLGGYIPAKELIKMAKEGRI